MLDIDKYLPRFRFIQQAKGGADNVTSEVFETSKPFKDIKTFQILPKPFKNIKILQNLTTFHNLKTFIKTQNFSQPQKLSKP